MGIITRKNALVKRQKKKKADKYGEIFTERNNERKQRKANVQTNQPAGKKAVQGLAFTAEMWHNIR